MSEGDIDCRNKIIECNIKLVLYRISTRFKVIPYDKNDLASVGLIGLIKAVDTYDINKEVKFVSYAVRCIDNEILMQIRKAKKYSGEVSLDTPLNDTDDDSLNLLDTICDDDDFVENLVENDNSSIIYKAINEFVEELSPRNRDIVKLCFGFGPDASPMSQEEVGKFFGLSRSYISRILKQSLIEIKRGLLREG